MTRAELTRYIFDTYNVEPDYPFHGDDTSAVFRPVSYTHLTLPTKLEV